MKVKRLVLCMMLSVAMVVTFIPMIAFAQDSETEDQSAEVDVQIEEPALPADISKEEIKEKVENVEKDSEEPAFEAKEATDEITSISINLKRPLCGTVVTGNKMNGVNKQKPQPEATVPSGARYELYGDSEYNYGLWFSMTEYGWDIFEGVMRTGGTYVAEVDICSKELGVAFAENPTISLPAGCTVEDYEPYYYDEYDFAYCEVYINVQPVHNYVKNYVYGTGYLKNGIQCDKCRGCGAEVNRKTVGGWSTKYVKSAKAKKGKKSITVKWKKQSKKNQKKFDGYEIRYSTTNNLNAAKAITVGKSKKSKKIGKLAKKTKYYVWICSYKNVNGVRNYSTWKWGTVKTK